MLKMLLPIEWQQHCDINVSKFSYPNCPLHSMWTESPYDTYLRPIVMSDSNLSPIFSVTQKATFGVRLPRSSGTGRGNKTIDRLSVIQTIHLIPCGLYCRILSRKIEEVVLQMMLSELLNLSVTDCCPTSQLAAGKYRTDFLMVKRSTVFSFSPSRLSEDVTAVNV